MWGLGDLCHVAVPSSLLLEVESKPAMGNGDCTLNYIRRPSCKKCIVEHLFVVFTGNVFMYQLQCVVITRVRNIHASMGVRTVENCISWVVVVGQQLLKRCRSHAGSSSYEDELLQQL